MSILNRCRIGIAIGPRVWFGDQKGNNVSTGGIVDGNHLTGAFSYGIAMNSATNFTVENNVLIGNTSFIGVRGPNCTANRPIPSPAAFVMGRRYVQECTTQWDFMTTSDCDNLPCVQPPSGNEASLPVWKHPHYNDRSASSPEAAPTATGSSHLSTGTTAGIVFGTIGAVLLVALVAWRVRKWALKRSQAAKL